MKSDIDVFELRKILHKILSSDVGWDVEHRQFKVPEESLIDIAESLLRKLKRGAK